MFDNILFLVSATITCSGALAVVFEKRLMHACIYLLATLFGVAGLYATLGADFLAAAQLVVYAGGVVILMLFAVMLTGGAESRPNRFGLVKVPAMGSFKTYFIAGSVGLLIGAIIFKLVFNFLRNYQQAELPPYTATVDKIGVLLATDHVLAFEISSILLLGALIGAAIIARPKRRF